jgi:ABC-type oligopeptide transport system substrate-binding subunit
VADIPDPGVLLQTLVHQPYIHWRNDEFKRLMDAARRIADQAERVKYCQAADRLLIEDAAVIPLTYACRHDLLKPWVKSFPVSPLETFYWKYIVMGEDLKDPAGRSRV